LSPAPRRNRWVYAIVIIVVVALGFGSRLFGDDLPRFVAAYAGDTLWAVLVFLLAAWLWRSARTSSIAIGAGVFALLVEVSQLDQTSWLAKFRSTSIAAAFLGTNFIWTDLVCYAVGIGVGVVLDRRLIRAH
jgi:hypothetical protein